MNMAENESGWFGRLSWEKSPRTKFVLREQKIWDYVKDLKGHSRIDQNN